MPISGSSPLSLWISLICRTGVENMGIFAEPVFLSTSKQRPSSQFSSQSLGLPARCQSKFGSVGFQDPYHRTVPVTADHLHFCLLHWNMICSKYLLPQNYDVTAGHSPCLSTESLAIDPIDASEVHARLCAWPDSRIPRGIINTCVDIDVYIYIYILMYMIDRYRKI